MTALVFILGLLIILGISRYNESNKLFWTLLTSFVFCFAGTKIIVETFGEKGQSEKSLNQAYPTQGLDAASDTCMCFFNDELYKANVKETSKPVGQVNMPETSERTYTLSDVPVVTPGLYLHNLPNPPNEVILYDTS